MGRLYVVATPIGNLEDITIRAIKTLLTVPVIACEDTRRTGQLIKILQDKFNFLIDLIDLNHKKFISVRDWNEERQVAEVMQLLKTGDAALVSDAGTPLLSDPGFKIVRQAREEGIQVIPVPGPFAGATAVSASGLPTNKIMFWGFLPKKYDLIPNSTNIIYESPYRSNKLMADIRSRYPDARIVIGRELTKIYEYIGPDDGKTSKGEITILVYLPQV